MPYRSVSNFLVATFSNLQRLLGGARKACDGREKRGGDVGCEAADLGGGWEEAADLGGGCHVAEEVVKNGARIPCDVCAKIRCL